MFFLFTEVMGEHSMHCSINLHCSGSKLAEVMNGLLPGGAKPLPEQVERPVIWNVMTAMLRHCNNKATKRDFGYK